MIGSSKGLAGWIESFKEKRRLKSRTRPTTPDAKREVIGVLLILFSIIVIELVSTHVFFIAPAGLIFLALIIFVSCWSGLRAGVIGSALLVSYTWLIYRYNFSAFVKDPSKMTQAVIASAIFYLLFAVTAGIVQSKLRASAIREFDAREAAEEEARQRQIAEAELGVSEDMRRLIVESSIDAVVAMDEKGTITLWNPNAQALFGWTAAEAIGRSLAQSIIPTRLQARFEEGLRRFRETGESAILQRHFETTALAKDGRELEVELHIAPQKTPTGWIFIGFIRDIRERKLAEHAIRDLNFDLERRVAERTAQLESANAELVGFTYSVSHDLRAPLRGIVGNCRMLLEDAKGELDAKSVDRLHRLESAALRMAQLIEDLLQFARIGQVDLKRSEVDVTAIAESIAEDLRSTKEGTISIQPGLKTQGDSEMLAIVMRNLMENAWKYVPAGEAPSVEVGRNSEGSFFVRDRGIGFSMNYAEKIFQPFERLHHEHEFQGTGIGLANAKRILKRHGGDIRVESAPGVGTTFLFDLPGSVSHPVSEKGKRSMR